MRFLEVLWACFSLLKKLYSVLQPILFMQTCTVRAYTQKSLTKHRDILSTLRQALVAIISYAPIRSVRTFFLWKLTAITHLQIGHLILIMPSTASGSASNNLLFLQHGQATCTSCIHFSPPDKKAS